MSKFLVSFDQYKTHISNSVNPKVYGGKYQAVDNTIEAIVKHNDLPHAVQEEWQDAASKKNWQFFDAVGFELAELQDSDILFLYKSLEHLQADRHYFVPFTRDVNFEGDSFNTYINSYFEWFTPVSVENDKAFELFTKPVFIKKPAYAQNSLYRELVKLMDSSVDEKEFLFMDIHDATEFKASLQTFKVVKSYLAHQDDAFEYDEDEDDDEPTSTTVSQAIQLGHKAPTQSGNNHSNANHNNNKKSNNHSNAGKKDDKKFSDNDDAF